MNKVYLLLCNRIHRKSYVFFQEADFAAAPLYVTKQREEVVDFSEPFLTVQATILLSKYHEYPDITSAIDLLFQDEIEFGTLNTGVIINAFRHTNSSVYRQIWKVMKNSRPSVFTRSNIEGLDRVRAGQYAFILPTTIGQYISKQTHCDLKTVDRFLMNRHFALATAKDSGLVNIMELISKHLRLLKRRGKLDKIYKKWWIDQNNCGMIKRSSVIGQNQEILPSKASSPPVIADFIMMFVLFVSFY